MAEIDKENETPSPALLKNSIEAKPKEDFCNESIEEKRTLISYFKDCIDLCGICFYCCSAYRPNDRNICHCGYRYDIY